MKLTFIGTGAADWPLIRPEEYTEFRRLSSTLVDDCLLIDPGPQVLDGLDGAWLLYEEVQAIKEYRPDLAILDATIGEKEGDYRIFEHNNLRMVREIQMTLKPYIKQFCIDHMARTLHTDHQSLEENMKAYGIMVAYDGLEIEI